MAVTCAIVVMLSAAPAVQASWLVRLLTTPPEMITAAIQPDEEKLARVPGIEMASRALYPRHHDLSVDDEGPIDGPLGDDPDVITAEGILPPALPGVDEDPRFEEDSVETQVLATSATIDDAGEAPEPTSGDIQASTTQDLPPETQVASITRFRTRPGPVPDLERDLQRDPGDAAEVLPDSSLSAATQVAMLSRTLQIPEEGFFSYTLKQEGVSEEDAKAIVAAIKPHYDLRNVPKGTTLSVKLNGHVPAGTDGRIESIYLAPNSLTKLTVRRKDTGGFNCIADTRKLQTRWIMARGSIKNGNIHSDAERYNIPPRIVANMIRAHRHWLNLEKSLSKGDQFSVLFEAEVDPKTGEIYKSGEIRYTAIRYKGKKTGLYWFQDGSNSNWFKSNGASTKRGMTLSRKPIKSGRMSSKFGLRRHPILKTRKMHWGTDYAAPTGTPIYAAGGGTVTYSGWKGGYGRHVQIKHNGTYSTTYSHMSRFAKGMKKGKRVSRGQVIGYVGSSGRSTGPHLHYEVVKNGKKVNPLGKQVPVPYVLSGSRKSKFNQQVSKVDRLVANAMDGNQARLR